MGRVLMRAEGAKTESDRRWAENHEREVRTLFNALSRTVSYAIRTTSVSEFAQRIHYTRSTLNTLLKQSDKRKQRPWTLDTLVAVADALGCRLSDLITAAEGIMDKPESEPSLSLRLCGTAPHTRERLQRLIYEAFGYDGDWDERKCDKLAVYTYRVKGFECGVPEFCRQYYDGVMSDADALAWLRKAAEWEWPPDEEPYPPWAALKEVYSR